MIRLAEDVCDIAGWPAIEWEMTEEDVRSALTSRLGPITPIAKRASAHAPDHRRDRSRYDEQSHVLRRLPDGTAASHFRPSRARPGAIGRLVHVGRPRGR